MVTFDCLIILKTICTWITEIEKEQIKQKQTILKQISDLKSTVLKKTSLGKEKKKKGS